MRRLSQAMILALALALFAGISLMPSRGIAQAKPSGGDHTLAIGVVHMEDVLKNMAEMKKFQTDGHARLTELRQQQQQLETELQEMQKHRENLKQGTQQWINETNAIDDKAAKLEIWKQVAQIQMDRWQKQTLNAMYDHISAASAQVAESLHLDLIVADQSPQIGPDMDKVDMAKLQLALQSRTVLFTNKKADVTQDVLTQVDANFAKQGQIAGPPPLPAPATGH